MHKPPLLEQLADWLSDLMASAPGEGFSFHGLMSRIQDHAVNSGIYEVLIGVAVIIALGWIWWLVALVLGGTSVGSLRVIAERLALGLRRREPADAMLSGLGSTLPLVLGVRVRQAARGLAHGHVATLVGALKAHRLLPRRLLALAASAEALGADVLAAVFAVISQDSLIRERMGRRFVPTTTTLIVILLMGSFMGSLIIPKLEWISADLGLPAPDHASAWHWSVDHLFTAVVPALICLVAVGSFLAWLLHWRSQQRRIAGEILLAASAARLDEAAISRSLGLPEPGQGFAGLCHATGWSARDPAELAHAVRRWQERHDRLRILVATACEILAPVALGVLVLFMVRSVFGWLIRIVFGLGDLTW
jgi:hypothetical protein